MNAGETGNRGKKSGLIRHILLGIAGIMVGVNIYLWNAQSLVGNTMPMPFGYGFAVVLSGSMEPALRVNDLVIIKAEESYEIGDIVVFQSGSERIIHRIIGMDSESIQTQGDANAVADGAVDKAMVKGKLLLRIPGMGLIAKVLKNPAVTVSVLIAAFLLVELSYRREMKDDRQEQIKEEIRQLKKEMEEAVK